MSPATEMMAADLADGEGRSGNETSLSRHYRYHKPLFDRRSRARESVTEPLESLVMQLTGNAGV